MKYFIIYALLGFILEIIFISYSKKKLVNTHFLFTPLCPMYGIGGILISKYTETTNNLILIFLISIIISIIIEYTTSYIMEYLYHHRWWNYTHKKYNLKGRICLINSIEFGILGILIKYINPYITKLNIDINIIKLLTVIFIIDLIISSIYTYLITNNKPYKKNILTKLINHKLSIIP